MVDVSGSMSGIPMEVAIALGLIVCNVADPLWQKKFLTFDTNPSWVDVSDCPDFKSMVAKTRGAYWGGSTNFSLAMDLILQVVIENSLSWDDIPKMIVFSDMQFDRAIYGSSGSWDTTYEVIKNKWISAGYPAPPDIIFLESTIICWSSC